MAANQGVVLPKGAMITILGVPKGLERFFPMQSRLGNETRFVTRETVEFGIDNDEVTYLHPAQFLVEKVEGTEVVICFQALPGWNGN